MRHNVFENTRPNPTRLCAEAPARARKVLPKENAMLVLTRRLGESVVIDGGIQVTVVAVQGDKVRLGIVAPPSVRVDRKEVHDRRAEFDAGPVMVAMEVRP